MVGNYYGDKEIHQAGQDGQADRKNQAKKNRAEAIHYYLQAIALDRRFSKPFHNIGNLLLDEAFEEMDPAAKEVALQSAERAYRKAIRLERCDASSYDGVALIEMERKKYEVAREAAKQAVKCDPNDGSYLATLGLIQLRSGATNAERIINDASAIDPEDPQVNLAMAELYEHREEYDKAADHFARYFESYPSDVNRRRYARTLHRAGEHEKAMETLGRPPSD
jgi:tetratricopeptide (TPR) repeat protein